MYLLFQAIIIAVQTHLARDIASNPRKVFEITDQNPAILNGLPHLPFMDDPNLKGFIQYSDLLWPEKDSLAFVSVTPDGGVTLQSASPAPVTCQQTLAKQVASNILKGKGKA